MVIVLNESLRRPLAAFVLVACLVTSAAPVFAQTAAQVDRIIAAGKAAFERNDFAHAISSWQSVLPALRKAGDKRVGDVSFLIGISYQGAGNTAKAATAFREALAAHRKLGDRARTSGDLSSLGSAEERLGRNQAALADYQQALALDRALEDAGNVADDLGRVGKVQRLLGRYDDALAALAEALPLDRANNDRPGEAEHVGELGNVLNLLARYDQALAAQQQALALHRALKDRLGEAQDLGNVGNALENLGRFDEAFADDQQALAIDRELKNRAGEASDLGNLGNLQRDLGHYADALASTQQALLLHHALGNRLEEAADQLNLGGIEEQLGRYDDALDALRSAYATDRDAGDTLGEADALADIGGIEEQLGSDDAALTSLRQSLAMHRAIGARLGAANDLGAIGGALSDLGRYAEALASHQEALALDREIANRVGEAGDLVNIGNVQENLGHDADGLTAYQQALDIDRALKSSLGEAADLANVGTVEDVLGRYADARQNARAAVALDTQLSTPEALWRALAAAAYADAHLEHRDDALAEYDAALDAVESLRASLSGSERAGFFGTRLFVYDEYIAYLIDLDAKFPGKGYDRKALEILERKTARAALEQIGASAAHHFRGVDPTVVAGEDAAESELDRAQTARTKLLATAGAPAAALAAAESTVNAAKQRLATLEATIAARYPAYYALRHPQPLAAQCKAGSCATIAGFQQKSLRPGELVMAYAVLDRQSALWLIERDRIQLVPLGPGEDIDKAVAALAKHIAGMSQAVDDGARPARLDRDAEGDLPGFAADSYALYRKLVPAPAAAALARAKSAIVVPSGSLYRVAFETLVTKDPATDPQPHYLLESLPVSYVPSASLLAVVRDSYARPTAGRGALLAFANPTFGTDAAGAARGASAYAGLQLAAARSVFAGASSTLVFPALPGTQTEAEAVRVALGAPQTSLIAGDQATRARVLALDAQDRLKAFRYVLFATHAVLPSEIKGLTQPAIVLAHPERGDGLLSMADVFGLSLDADFVALSACNTGVTASDSGGGISGFTRAFLFAGTPALSVTLWTVYDAAAPQITPAFFAGMHAGLPPAEALRQAKLALLKSPQARFRHPYSWGPSVVFGDGDALTAGP